jgi:hypothetical protein
VSHVYPQLGAHLIGNLAERGKVHFARVGRPAGNQNGGLVFASLVAHHVHVDQKRFGINAVRCAFVNFARKVELHAVGQVTAVSQF